jgi:Ser-tRNA(Ala) deacylase AlaX
MDVFEFADRYNELTKRLTLSRDEVLDLVEEFAKKNLDTNIYIVEKKVNEKGELVTIRKKVRFGDLLRKAREGDSEAMEIINGHIRNWLSQAERFRGRL